MPATEVKITACAAHYKKLLEALPQPPESLSQAPDSRLHKIIERAGAKRRSEALMSDLDRAFTNEGIITFPSLTDQNLDLDDRIYMLDAAHLIKGLARAHQLFRDEATLQDFIATHHDWFPALRRLELHQFEEQMILDGGRRVDLLCKRRGSTQLVGIELKAEGQMTEQSASFNRISTTWPPMRPTTATTPRT